MRNCGGFGFTERPGAAAASRLAKSDTSHASFYHTFRNCWEVSEQCGGQFDGMR